MPLSVPIILGINGSFRIFSQFYPYTTLAFNATSIGVQPQLLNTFHSVMIMYFFNMFVPRLGEGNPLHHACRINENVPRKIIRYNGNRALIRCYLFWYSICLYPYFFRTRNFNAIYKEFQQLTAGIKGGTVSACT